MTLVTLEPPGDLSKSPKLGPGPGNLWHHERVVPWVVLTLSKGWGLTYSNSCSLFPSHLPCQAKQLYDAGTAGQRNSTSSTNLLTPEVAPFILRSPTCNTISSMLIKECSVLCKREELRRRRGSFGEADRLDVTNI